MVKIRVKPKASLEITAAFKALLPEKPETPPLSLVEDKPKDFILDGKFWDMQRDGITQSIIQLFALCPMKTHYKLIEGLGSATKGKDKALDFGTFFHDCLDKIYSNPPGNFNTVLTKCYSDAKKRMQQEGADIKQMQEFEVVYGTCQTLLKRYFAKWKKEDAAIKWVDLERVFSFPYQMRDGTIIQVRGKFDGVFRDKKGKLWLFETKTKSKIEGNGIMESIGYNLQVMVYMLAMKHVYRETPAGVLYNLVKRPGQEFKGTYYKKTETIPDFLERIDADIVEKESEYFARYVVGIRWQEVEEYRDMDLDYIMQRIYEWQQGGYSNFRNSAACSMWNRPCEYLPICSAGERNLYTRKLTVFPELEANE